MTTCTQTQPQNSTKKLHFNFMAQDQILVINREDDEINSRTSLEKQSEKNWMKN